VVANATLTTRNVDTNETTTVTSNEVGRYRSTFLNPGRYSISAVSAGL
jgi:hypothetical protein